MPLKKIPLPGFRTIKTAIAVLVCLLLYPVIGRQNVLLALFAAFICLQDSITNSIKSGVNRIIGVAAGGVFALILALVMGTLREKVLVWYIITSIGVILLIYLFNIVKLNDCITMGAIVFLVIMLDSSLDSPLMYTVNYGIDSIIGIVIAVAVNYLPLGSANDRGVFKGPGGKVFRLYHKTIRGDSLISSKWSGGTTTELVISPHNAILADKDFDFRISAAKTEAEQSEFSNFSGFTRHLMVLEGTLTLVREGQGPVSLSAFEQDCFDGGLHTTAYGKCRDFNLILAKEYDGKMIACENNATYFLKDVIQGKLINTVCALYSPFGEITIAVFYEEKLMMRCALSAGDMILFEKLDHVDGALKFIPFTKEMNAANIVCTAVYIAKRQSFLP